MTYIKFQPSDIVVDSEKIVKPAWENNTSILTAFYTPNINDNGLYVDVYKDSPSVNPLTDVQFSIAYGNISGIGNVSGSAYQTSDGTKFSKIIYSTLRQNILNSETDSFTFSNTSGSNSTSVLAISVARGCFKESIKAGFNLVLKNGNNILSLTDDSNVDLVNNYIGSSLYYNIISGSNGNLGTGQSIINTTKGTYGIVLPDLGLILLNADALAQTYANKGIGLIINATPTNVTQRNELNLFTLIQAGTKFELYSEETVTSKYFYCRASNSDFNYTTNPSIIDVNGNIYAQTLIDNPTTYVTTIGLYSDKHELVAVSKVSKPIKKSFILESLIRTKLSW
jgi:hypothetical protein